MSANPSMFQLKYNASDCTPAQEELDRILKLSELEDKREELVDFINVHEKNWFLDKIVETAREELEKVREEIIKGLEEEPDDDGAIFRFDA